MPSLTIINQRIAKIKHRSTFLPNGKHGPSNGKDICEALYTTVGASLLAKRVGEVAGSGQVLVVDGGTVLV
ncbi:hypothetical protein KTO58_16540 [Chitinophaga pendula]|uniref:hypothetical protein n=1 Tax=Chitinophaga TaxID=79328 RepID=UPI0012FE6211|nr:MULTISPECIES: hypothetical protein [Chitinophaga]UCJ05298.1 hypothetical protein KTO58_16540 [Chitinophaga pendula]